MKKFIDTNILVRYIVNDVEDQADFAAGLFKNAYKNKESLFILPEVFVELNYVLKSSYNLEKNKVKYIIGEISNLEFLKIAEIKNLNLSEVSNIYSQTNLSYEDCLYLQTCIQFKYNLITFDKKLLNAFEKLTKLT